LAYAQWDITALTSKLIRLVIAEEGAALRYGSHYLIGIDTTFAAKVQGRMLGVQKWRQKSQNPDRGKSIVGHHWAIAGFLARIGNRWRCLPVLTRLISGQIKPSHIVVDASGAARTATFWDTTVAMVRQMAQEVCSVKGAFFQFRIRTGIGKKKTGIGSGFSSGSLIVADRFHRLLPFRHASGEIQFRFYPSAACLISFIILLKFQRKFLESIVN